MKKTTLTMLVSAVIFNASAFAEQAVKIDDQLFTNPYIVNSFKNTAPEKVISTKPEKDGFGLHYDNNGNRYNDAQNAAGDFHINAGNDVELKGAVAGDFEGGKYHDYKVGLARKTLQYGAFSFGAEKENYKTDEGREYLGKSGDVLKLTFAHDYQFNDNWALQTSVKNVDHDFEFDANKDVFGYGDNQKYTSVQSKVTYFNGSAYRVAKGNDSRFIRENGVGASAEIEQGLGFLWGDDYKKFTRGKVELWDQIMLPSGFALVTKADYQQATEHTPVDAQYMIGGFDHGRAYSAGLLSAPDGGSASLTAYSPEFAGVRTYVGADSAFALPAEGARENASSAFVGATYKVNKLMFVDVSYAHAIGAKPAAATDSNKVLASATLKF